MKKTLFVLLAAVAASFPAFAIDGQILINQSTVMAAGGFPYTITQPGSYKLSGNLTAPLDVNAILISSSNVSLDLNGFTISCPFDVPGGSVFCVSDFTGPATYRKIAIRNGAIDVSQVGGGITANPTAMFVRSSNVIIEELQVEIHVLFPPFLNSGVPSPLFLDGTNSIVRHNILRADVKGSVIQGSTRISCPSLVVENVLSLAPLSGTCVAVNNVFPN